MKMLSKLTIQNMKLNKKRTLVTIIGIILSVALIAAASSLFVSGMKSLVTYEKERSGDFHMSLKNVPEGELKNITGNRYVESSVTVSVEGHALIEGCKNEFKPYACILSMNDKAMKSLSLRLVSGRLPENSGEIVVPRHLKTNGRVELKVGDTITLDVGKRVSEEDELEPSTPYIGEKEHLVDTTKKTYKIVGIIERPGSRIEDWEAPGYSFVTYSEKNTENVDIYLRLTKKGMDENSRAYASLVGIDVNRYVDFVERANKGELSEAEWSEYTDLLSEAKYECIVNEYLIEFENMNIISESLRAYYTIIVFVILIIIVTSVFCIKNSFDISISEKVRQYGMLASVGATKAQIRKNVFFEATVLACIGVPLGILGGLLATYILIIVSNYLLNVAEQLLILNFTFSPVAIILSVILGFVTVYLSAIRSAVKASKVSPMVAIRSNEEIKLKSKKLRIPGFIKPLFGIGGAVSYKSIKRNKSKYRTTTISIMVCVIAFIAVSTFINITFKVLAIEVGERKYNVLANVGSIEVYEKEADKLLNMDNVKRVSAVKRSMSICFENVSLSRAYCDYAEVDYSNKEEMKHFLYVNVSQLDDETYSKYLKDIGISKEEAKGKGILVHNIAYERVDEKNKTVYGEVDKFEVKKGDTVSFRTDYVDKDNESYSVEIAAITDKKPFGLEDSTCMLFVDDSVDVDYDYVSVFYDSSDADKLQDELETILGDETYIDNLDANTRSVRAVYLLMGIFLYGFITVIALIGVTNIFNTIHTGMELRSREFAMLKSIGMTGKEFNRMIRLESIFLCTRSLILGIPIGCVLSYLIYHSMDELKFVFPLREVLISVIAVFLLIFCIMKYSVGRVKDKNIIETIRNENI